MNLRFAFTGIFGNYIDALFTVRLVTNLVTSEVVPRALALDTELLDKHIHSKRKFLTDSETAECFVRYLQSTEKKGSMERVISSGSMQMSYEVFCQDDGKERLCEAYTFDSLGAFLYVDFFRGLSRCYLPKRCDNCER